MHSLKKTANILDKILHVVSILLIVGIVASVIGIGIAIAGTAFGLAPEQIGTGFNTIEIGSLVLTVADSYMPDTKLIMTYTAIDLAFTLLCLIAGHWAVRCLRRILSPMTMGRPFGKTVGRDLKTLALITVVLGLLSNIVKVAEMLVVLSTYDLTGLLVSDKITAAAVSQTFDMGFLLVAGALFLLHYVFTYGEQLQKQADETL